jgi:hypothetical protein
VPADVLNGSGAKLDAADFIPEYARHRRSRDVGNCGSRSD